jgi:hypothetical protein
LAAGRRACALCLSRSRWSPRAAPPLAQVKDNSNTIQKKHTERNGKEKILYQDLSSKDKRTRTRKSKEGEGEILRVVEDMSHFADL